MHSHSLEIFTYLGSPEPILNITMTGNEEGSELSILCHANGGNPSTSSGSYRYLLCNQTLVGNFESRIECSTYKRVNKNLSYFDRAYYWCRVEYDPLPQYPKLARNSTIKLIDVECM